MGLGERLLKWAKRRPALAAVASVTCLAAVLLICLSVAFNFRLAQEKRATDEALRREVRTNTELTRALYFHRISLGITSGWPTTWLGRRSCSKPAPELRQWEWRYLKRLCQSGFVAFLGHGGEVTCVAFDAKGKRVASASLDGTVKVWDADTGQVLHTLRGHDAQVVGVAFSPDGRRWPPPAWDKTVKVWDVSTGRLLHTLAGHPDRVFCVTFSPDGRRLASGSEAVRVWDATTGDLLGICTANPAHP